MNKQNVTFPQLWNEIGGSTRMTMDHLLMQMANSLDKREDFNILTRDSHYVVSVDAMETYFREHQRPKKPSTVEEENKALKAEVTELKNRISDLIRKYSGSNPKVEAPTSPVVVAEQHPDGEPDPVAPIQEPQANVAELMSARPQTATEILDGLAQELKGKQPRPLNRVDIKSKVKFQSPSVSSGIPITPKG